MFKRGRAQQQQNLYDPYQSFSPVVERMLKESWAGDFFENVFLAIDEQRFSVLYSEKYSRPNAPINLLISLLILKELNHLTDEELLESLAFDYRFHYALGIEDIEHERICINTLTNFRRRLLEHENQTGQDLLQEEIQSLSLHLADRLELDRTWARMDSMMIASACKKMSRLQLVYTVIRNAIKELDHLDEVPEGFQDFLSPSHEKETLYRTRTDEAQTRLECLWKHAIQLYTATSSMEAFVQTEAHAHLARLLREQTIETEEGRRLPIPGKEIPSTGLQNPSDPDATYRKKGTKSFVGYAANFVEVRDSEKKVGLILHHEVKPNIHSDADFGERFITEGETSSLETVVADGAYYRAETVKQAKDQGISFYVTQMTRKNTDEKVHAHAFESDEDTHTLVACPAGHPPEHALYDDQTGVHLAKFAINHCQSCPLLPSCLVKKGKRSYTLRITEKQRIASHMRMELTQPEHRKRACFRAGVEGIPSVLRRTFRIDQLPIFGFVRSKMWISLKIMAYNLKRSIHYRRRTALGTS